MNNIFKPHKLMHLIKFLNQDSIRQKIRKKFTHKNPKIPIKSIATNHTIT